MPMLPCGGQGMVCEDVVTFCLLQLLFALLQLAAAAGAVHTTPCRSPDVAA